ncbi:MAG TPA: hypothetical protein VFC63_00685 [Blastocatellia bacterium]|nr:hypothetical protein [Blastocatellia bacterium]
MSGRMKLFLNVIEMWVGLLFAIFALPYDLPKLTSLATLVFVLSGLVMIVVFLFTAACGGNRHEPLISIALIILFFYLTFGNGLRSRAQIHLLTNQIRYETILKQIRQANNDKERDQACGDNCTVLSLQPLRVAFTFSDSAWDWDNIVYEPRGELANANRDDNRVDSKWRYASLTNRELLDHDWYLEHFSDG